MLGRRKLILILFFAVFLFVMILSFVSITGRGIFDFFKMDIFERDSKDRVDANYPVVGEGAYIFAVKGELNDAMENYLKGNKNNISFLRRLDLRRFEGFAKEKSRLPPFIESFEPILEKPSVEDIISFKLDNLSIIKVKGDDGKIKKYCEVLVRFFGAENHSDYLRKAGFEFSKQAGEYSYAYAGDCSEDKLKDIFLRLHKSKKVRDFDIFGNYALPLDKVTVLTKSREINRGDTPYKTPYTGKSALAGIWDATYAGHHKDFSSRILYRQCGIISCKIIRSYPDLVDHPNLVAGALLGDGYLSNGQYRGIAPKLRAFSYDVLYAASEIITAANIYKIDVASNSWHALPGASLHGNFHGPRLHGFSRLFNWAAYEVNDTPLVFAAGNTRCDEDGPMSEFCRFIRLLGAVCDPENYYKKKYSDYMWDCLYPPSSSKNTLTVGSINFSDNVSSYSSVGPTWDGRLKPDVVTYGEDVVTTSIFLPSGYAIVSGTSISTPVVSGHVALLKEFLRERANKIGKSTKGYESALIKAALIHTAEDIGPVKGPDFLSGWGKINPKEAMKLLAENSFILDSFDKRSMKKVKKYPIRIPPFKEIKDSLKVTLAYLDYWDYYASSGSELSNKLSLTVCDDSGAPVGFPFVFNKERPGMPAKKGFNIVDNVQQVVLEPEELKRAINVNVNHVYACVRFVNYYDSPNVNQGFVLIISDLNRSDGKKDFELTCGNKKLEPEYGEECEYLGYIGNRWDFGGKTCRDYAPNEPITGKLRCNKQCKIETENCFAPQCGNGFLDKGEMCDPSVKDSYKIGCYSDLDGPGKACKEMCVTDNDCQGPGRGQMYCVDGVCQGCGDGEIDVNEECDPSSRTLVSSSCSNLYGSVGQGTIRWICTNFCQCFSPGGETYMCKGKQVLSKPKCQDDKECKKGEICNDKCRCEPGYRCDITGKTSRRKYQCQSKTEKEDCVDKKLGDICTGNCECKYQCPFNKKISDKPFECKEDKDCGPNKKCSNSCECIDDPFKCGNKTIPHKRECFPPGDRCYFAHIEYSGVCDDNCTCREPL